MGHESSWPACPSAHGGSKGCYWSSSAMGVDSWRNELSAGPFLHREGELELGCDLQMT